MKKVNPSLAKNLERIFFKWIWIRRYRTLSFILLVLFLIVFSKAPYINLFFNSFLIIFVSTILAPLILNIDDRHLFVILLVFLLLLLPVWLVDRDSAQMLANYIFILIFSAVVKALLTSL